MGKSDEYYKDTYAYCESTVEIWMNKLNENQINSAVLDDEIKQINGAIDNEKIWAEGSDGTVREMHEENVATLIEYREHLEEMKTELEEDKEM